VASDFLFPQGIDIDNAEGIHECYEINGNNLMANVSFENLKRLLRNLCNSLNAPLFFFIEIPSSPDFSDSSEDNDKTSFQKMFIIWTTARPMSFWLLSNGMATFSSTTGLWNLDLRRTMMKMKFV